MNPRPWTVLLADHALGELAGVVKQHAARRVFLVVDRDAVVASNADSVLAGALASCKVTRFTDFRTNPRLEDVQRGVAACRRFQPDLVIAFGGGTAIDLAKLIGAISAQADTNPGVAEDVIAGRAKLDGGGVPLVAIPTTAGTGSEATQFAVAYIGDVKYSVAHPDLLPDHAIIDPTLTSSLPPAITAATGLDAFCQAIESVWAVGATDQSVQYATEAIELAAQHLVDAFARPDPVSRHGMSRASHLAGKAINISKTTASHALSYAFTSRHQIPHGMAVALTLSRVLAYNADVTDQDCLDQRGAEAVRGRIQIVVRSLGQTSVPAACRCIDRIIHAVGCPTSPSAAGVCDRRELGQIVDSVNAQRMSNNPRAADKSALMSLLENPVAIENTP